MIVKDIDDEKRNLRLLIEEQEYNGFKYVLSDSFAPDMEVEDKSISISTFNDDSINEYETIKGLLFYNGKVKSYINTNNRNNSTTSSRFTPGDLDLYDEVINGFNELIESGNCEFTNKALEIYEFFQNYYKKVGSVK